jgi:hypothetical protein
MARTFDWMANRIELLMAAERRLLLATSHERRTRGGCELGAFR